MRLALLSLTALLMLTGLGCDDTLPYGLLQQYGFGGYGGGYDSGYGYGGGYGYSGGYEYYTEPIYYDPYSYYDSYSYDVPCGYFDWSCW